ncbi:hypothetical protein C8A05DRAFT_17454 [Staphylotrichum tortipilum]|uniref:N-acetylgalactosaminide beta-1,3-galactosyltransferase n=1 Tax=Staphylotrichum tortipilum TaxID=2831512 RepID=A0AAN6MGB7_9PEZI|nr:hypothetical protein C8A05DRAFT_17454 [Staphylotrichum longicolle]
MKRALGFLSPPPRGVLRYLPLLNKRLERTIAVIVGCHLLVALLLWHRHRSDPSPPPAFYPFETTSAFNPVAHHDAHNKNTSELCASFPNHLTQRIQPVLKMGHGENRAMVNAQFGSVSACFAPGELLVFSDLDETLHGHRTVDVLANLPRAYRDAGGDAGGTNPDYDNYEAMAALARDGKLTPDNDPARGKNGWRLDKYKFLAGVERAWLARPGRDFYVFYESDTYVSWDNMFRFLSALDPDAPLYMGSPSPGRHDEERDKDTWFANGGPGFVLSRGAMEKLFLRRASSTAAGARFTDPPFMLRWLDLLRSDPCGDSVLGWALWHAGVPLSGFFPLFNTYPAHALPFTSRLWCQPFLTMHKLRPEDMTGLWRWEHERRTLGRPLLYVDLYEFLPVATPDVRADWDNTNWDRLGPGRDVHVGTLHECREACEATADCLQYHWQGEHMRKCVLQPFINLGAAKSAETVQRKVPLDGPGGGRDKKKDGGKGAEGEQQQFRMVEERFNYTSGWLRPRIDRWVREHECTDPGWVYPSIERHY